MNAFSWDDVLYQVGMEGVIMGERQGKRAPRPGARGAELGRTDMTRRSTGSQPVAASRSGRQGGGEVYEPGEIRTGTESNAPPPGFALWGRCGYVPQANAHEPP